MAASLPVSSGQQRYLANRYPTLFSTPGIVQQTDASKAVEMARSVHIRWLVMSPNCHAAWEKEIHHAYANDGYRLYEMRP